MMNHTENEKERNEKLNGAMRIFGALSSVDVELLVRSEEEKKVIPFRKYTKVMTACASLLLVGLVTWTGVTMMSDRGNKEMAADCTAPENYEYAMDDSAVQNEAAMDWADGTLTTDCDAETTDDMGTVEESGGSEAPAEMEDLYDDVELEGTPVITNTTEYKKMTDAKMVEPFGKYIPDTLPAGYEFESARSTGNEGVGESLSLLWNCGMDYITLNISVFEASAENEGRIVDVAKRETYDVHMYEIPYAESVPDEYRLIFNNPIFREQDMSFEVIQARMKSVSDAGDTDTPRGNFAVLYDDGILVQFNGHGDAEEIWNMFCSVTGE